MSSGGDSSSSGNDSVSADVEAGLATESMADYSVSEGGTGGDQEEYNTVMEQFGPGTTPTTDTTYDAGGQDPGVPSPYTDVGTKVGSYINPNDTGSNLANNIRANIASDTATVTGTLGTATKILTNPVNFIVGQSIKGAYQTAKFNREMGRPMTQGILDTGGIVTTGTDNVTLQDTMDDIRDAGSNIQTRTVDTASTGLPEPSEFLFNFVGSKGYVQDLYSDVQGILNTPRSQQGLLAVSDSPYYDFLKASNLNRRVI